MAWMSGSRRIAQRSVTGPIQFNIFLNDLEGAKVLIRFADGAKSGGGGCLADTLGNRAATQRDLGKLQE